MKEMIVRTPYATYHNCHLRTDRYYNGNLFIEIVNEDGPVATLTTNFGRKLDENEAFVDINNNPFARSFIKEYRLGKETIVTKISGFCEYPMFRFDLERLAKFAYKPPKQTAIERFEIALKEALWQATLQAGSVPDNGTCNMDTLYVRLPRINVEKLKAVCEKNDVIPYRNTHKGMTSFWDVGKRFGQADRNTVGVRAMQEVFQSFGYETYIVYMMD